MTPKPTVKIPEYKKKIVDDMSDLIGESSIIALVNMSDIPAPQLQAMRREMRGKISIYMTKKRLMKIALDKSKDKKKNVEALANYFEGMPAFIFSNENPFRLSRLLQKSKTKAPAKTGQTAPSDIIISKGPTPFAPGPIISELSNIGLKVGVEGGKIAIKADTVIARKGEKIKPKVAEILARLDIRPMDVGLGMVAAYEDGIIYLREVLEIDEKAFNDRLNTAAVQAFNLAFNIAYTTKDNISLLIAKAFNDAKALGLSQNIFDEGIIQDLLGKAERAMLSLKDTANIETAEKPREKVKAEEKKVEAQIQEKVEKSAKKILEEEKSIIEEEKKLENEQIAPVPEEREVQEALKEEEEKELEKERIGKEKELEEAEGFKEPQLENDVDEKVNKMVENTKKFAEGKQETADDILKEVSWQEKKENASQSKKGQEVPPAHNPKAQKDAKNDEKARKEVEDLTKELLRKGTLRK